MPIVGYLSIFFCINFTFHAKILLFSTFSRIHKALRVKWLWKMRKLKYKTFYSSKWKSNSQPSRLQKHACLCAMKPQFFLFSLLNYSIFVVSFLVNYAYEIWKYYLFLLLYYFQINFGVYRICLSAYRALILIPERGSGKSFSLLAIEPTSIAVTVKCCATMAPILIIINCK